MWLRDPPPRHIRLRQADLVAIAGPCQGVGIPPRRAGLRQPVRGVIGGTALHLAQQPLIPGQVIEARVPAIREQHVLPGIRIGPAAGLAAAVLIDPQMRHQRRRLVQDRIGC